MLAGKEKGLRAWWHFPENEGTVTLDAVQSLEARFEGTRSWVNSSDTTENAFQLLVNGQTVPVKMSTFSPTFRDKQLALGGTVSEPESSPIQIQDGYKGEMDEVRIWRTVRTREQIRDNLFTRLQGMSPDLAAYYCEHNPVRSQSFSSGQASVI